MKRIELSFRYTLDWFMASDPFPLPEHQRAYIERRLSEQAKEVGYSDWIDAYHREPLGTCRKAMWMGGAPAGHCDDPAWGTTKEMRDFKGDNTSILYCPNHGGPPKPPEPPIRPKELGL